MKKIIKFNIFAVILINLVTVAPVFAQEKVKIKIGLIPHLTGAYAAVQAGANDTLADCINYANENNLIPGVELVGSWADGGTDVSKSMAAFKKLITETPKPVVIIGCGTPFSAALKSWHLKEMVPDVTGGSDLAFYRLPSATFSVSCPYQNQAGAFIDYFMEKIWKKKRKPRFAWLTWDNAAGRAPITDEVEAYIKSKGVDIVGAEFIPMTPVDMTTQLLRLKKLKVDVVYGCAYPYGKVLKDMQKLGLHGKITVGLMYWVDPNLVIKMAGPAAEGVWQTGIMYTSDSWPTKAPIVEELYTKNKRRSLKNVYGNGVWWVSVTIEAIKEAVKAVGAENVDGKAVFNALTTLKNFDNWGLAPPVSFSKTRRYGQDQVLIYHYENQKAKPIEFYPAPELIPGGKDVLK